MHFGRGIVATPEDFGSQGQLPTHPELLDWLTDRFIKEGWDLKALHRRIVLSATFRQSSVTTAEAAARDPGQPAAVPLAEDAAAGGADSRQRARRQRAAESDDRRTERQAVSARRAVGAVRDRQDLQAGHRVEAVSPQPLHLLEEDRAAAVDDRVRRRRRARSASPGAKRRVTPLQSLVLLNDPQFVEASRALAERVLERHPRERPRSASRRVSRADRPAARRDRGRHPGADVRRAARSGSRGTPPMR